MRGAWAFAVWLTASTASADTLTDSHPQAQDMLAALGGHGCTLGPESRAALIDQGIAEDAIDAVSLAALAQGAASVQGNYHVLDEGSCTIRLPQIESRWSPSDPLIQSLAPFTRSEYTLGDATYVDEGCFLADSVNVFNVLNNGDAEAGFQDYIAFAAAGVISGEVRFYADSPLRTPPGLQLLVGEECRAGANVPDIDATHAFIEDGFGAFIRAAYETNICGDGGFSASPDVVMALQGFDTGRDPEGQGPANTIIWLEWTFLTLAAGWHEGVGATEKGMPRPPLCQYR